MASTIKLKDMRLKDDALEVNWASMVSYTSFKRFNDLPSARRNLTEVRVPLVSQIGYSSMGVALFSTAY